MSGVADLKGIVHDLGVSVVEVDAQDGGPGHGSVGGALAPRVSPHDLRSLQQLIFIMDLLRTLFLVGCKLR